MAPPDDDPADPAAVQRLLDGLPAPAEPLDVVMLDGFLCAVLLRERPLPWQRWLPFVADIEGRSLPAAAMAPLRHTVLRRCEALTRAIAARRWFDPWLFELEGGASAAEAVMPWAAGFALAAERFALPAALHTDHDGREALALIYQFVTADFCPDAAGLADLIDELEPPDNLTDAAEQLVRAVLLLADAAGLPKTAATSGPQ